jgi:acetylornithine deacetylase/succinyl-diaminopimelate desuccinylase-like protein
MTIDQTWLNQSSDADDAAELTADLVRIRSYPGEEAAVQGLVAGWLDRAGIEDVGTVMAAPGRPNIVGRLDNGPGPTLMLNGHVDTVLAAQGWSRDPWQGWREGDRLYGLGACDMKSGVAAGMLAMRALARRLDLWSGSVVFTSVVDEEAYSVGARALLADGIRADACLVLEPSFDWPCLGSMGKVLVRVDVTGKAAHATWPDRGVNAAVEAARFVSRLPDLPLGQHPRIRATQCVQSLHSGSDQYVITVPEKATITINRHTVPGISADDVLAQMGDLAAELDSPARFDFAIDPPYYPPWEMPLDAPLVVAFGRAYVAETGEQPPYAYTGFGDANLFNGEAGIPTVQFGPLGGGLHEADEWVDIPSIGAAVRVILRLALDILPASQKD